MGPLAGSPSQARGRGHGRPGAATFLAVLLLAAAGGAAGAPAPARAPSGPSAPRLIVVVVIDQFRADALSRFRGRFGPGGFLRLLREGADFTECAYPYAVTETAPGHATLATGTTPDRHGIVANAWYDAKAGRQVAAVEDASAPILGGFSELPGASPERLIGSTFSDELRLATGGKAKVFGVALKDRAVIFSTGHAASGAFWYDEKAGTFISSRYYGEALPGWVEAWDSRHPADRYYGRDWIVDGKVAVALRSEAGRPDPAYYERLASTPFVHEMTLEFARELIAREEIGADATPDFLFLGLSGHDYLGHARGPYSREVEEMTAQTDALLADLLRFLDRRVGPGDYWLALSADHGVAPSAEQTARAGLRRGSLDEGELKRAVRSALEERFGRGRWLTPTEWSTRLVFDRETLRAKEVSLPGAVHTAGEAALAVPGVLGYFSPFESSLDAGLSQACRLGFYLGRSPDLLILRRPFTRPGGDSAATHGTPYSYDTRVPLLLYGPPFRPGTYRGPASPADLAPTLAAALGLAPPALASGRVLAEALRDARPAIGSAPR